MNKKFLSAILFGALMVSSTGTFVSCKDYDDDIDRIDNTLNDLKSKLDALQTKVEGGSILLFFTDVCIVYGLLIVCTHTGTCTKSFPVFIAVAT